MPKDSARVSMYSPKTHQGFSSSRRRGSPQTPTNAHLIDLLSIDRSRPWRYCHPHNTPTYTQVTRTV